METANVFLTCRKKFQIKSGGQMMGYYGIWKKRKSYMRELTQNRKLYFLTR